MKGIQKEQRLKVRRELWYQNQNKSVSRRNVPNTEPKVRYSEQLWVCVTALRRRKVKKGGRVQTTVAAHQVHLQDTEGELLGSFPPNCFLAPNAVPGCYLPKPHPALKMCDN